MCSLPAISVDKWFTKRFPTRCPAVFLSLPYQNTVRVFIMTGTGIHHPSLPSTALLPPVMTTSAPPSQPATAPKHTAQQTAQLQQQARRLEYFAYFYFFSFFLIVITAYIPFMVFQNAVREHGAAGSAALVPLLLGISFTLGMVVGVLALVQVMGAQAQQKLLSGPMDRPDQAQLAASSAQIKKLKLTNMAAMMLFAVAILVNLLAMMQVF